MRLATKNADGCAFLVLAQLDCAITPVAARPSILLNNVDVRHLALKSLTSLCVGALVHECFFVCG